MKRRGRPVPSGCGLGEPNLERALGHLVAASDARFEQGPKLAELLGREPLMVPCDLLA